MFIWGKEVGIIVEEVLLRFYLRCLLYSDNLEYERNAVERIPAYIEDHLYTGLTKLICKAGSEYKKVLNISTNLQKC